MFEKLSLLVLKTHTHARARYSAHGMVYPIMYQMNKNCDNKSLNKWMGIALIFDVHIISPWEFAEKYVTDRIEWISFLLFIFHVFVFILNEWVSECVSECVSICVVKILWDLQFALPATKYAIRCIATSTNHFELFISHVFFSRLSIYF